MTRSTRLLCLFVLAAAAGCGGHNSQPGPCDVEPPAPECMQECDPAPGAANTCPSGYHCAPDGFCTAACTQGGAECGSGRYCTSDGHCEELDGDANLGPDADCPDVEFTATQVIPTVQFLIDKSGSMDDTYGGGFTKYEALEDALVGGVDIVGQYQSSVYFGAALYSQQSGTCPELLPGASGTGRALNNKPAISSLITSNGPGGGTPTFESLTEVYQEMIANPGPPDSPPIIILATDGEPFLCPDNDQGTNAQARANVVSTAQASYAAGIRVFVLGLSVSSATDDHLQQVANAGVGQDPVTGTAPYYPADNPTALADAFAAIIGGVVSCDLTLDGDISPDQAAAGTVILNGTTLMYGTDWTLVGTNVIHLEAAACMALQQSTNPTVTANFPCGAVIEKPSRH
jgi:hypothetical protein